MDGIALDVVGKVVGRAVGRPPLNASAG
jgi:hypothetical protein